MRWIYISPHLDDAVLSCGGLMHAQAQRGLAVENWTILAGDPPPGPLSDFAQTLHILWGTGDAMSTLALRRREDLAASAFVGARAVHLGFVDCIYRRGPGGDLLYPESVFVPPSPLEADLPDRIVAVLEAGLRPDDVLVCPLALGSHLDHFLVRRAVEHLGRPLRYYADFPYMVNYPDALAPAVAGMHDERFPFPEENLLRWQEAVAAYASQISSLLKVEGTMNDILRSCWRESRGIRLWHTG